MNTYLSTKKRVPVNVTQLILDSSLLSCLGIGLCLTPSSAQAEPYVSGVAGINFADRLTDTRGTNGHVGQRPREPHFDLADSVAYGGTIEYVPEHRWFGIEGEILHTTSHTTLFVEYKYIGATLNVDQAFGAEGGFAGGYRAQYAVCGLSYHF